GDIGAPLARERQPWGAYALRAPAHEGLGELDGLHQVGVRVEVQERHEPAVDPAGALEVVCADGLIECQRLGGEGVGEPRYRAPRPERQRLGYESTEPGGADVRLADGGESGVTWCLYV